MPVVINTNISASVASRNLNESNQMLQKSLNRLSSGKKIVSPADDAGGLAVSLKLSAAIKRTDAVNTSIANAQSFLQTQDGAMATASKILDRMSELKTLSVDVTKNTGDIANYDTEFKQLQSQLSALSSEKFNGVSLFTAGASATTLAVTTTEDGTGTTNINQANLGNQVGTSLTAGTTDLTSVALSTITTGIQNVAGLRATNGAQTSRLSFAGEILTVNKTNLEGANSRIADVDVAQESTQLARFNILVQAGASMLTQANSSNQIALSLLR